MPKMTSLNSANVETLLALLGAGLPSHKERGKSDAGDFSADSVL